MLVMKFIFFLKIILDLIDGWSWTFRHFLNLFLGFRGPRNCHFQQNQMLLFSKSFSLQHSLIISNYYLTVVIITIISIILSELGTSHR